MHLVIDYVDFSTYVTYVQSVPIKFILGVTLLKNWPDNTHECINARGGSA